PPKDNNRTASKSIAGYSNWVAAPPSAKITVPVVAGSQSESSAQTVLATGVGSFMFQPSGARWSQPSSSSLIWAPASSPSAPPTIAAIASVRIGPAATRFERTPYLPASRATNRLTDSSALLATVIQL